MTDMPGRNTGVILDRAARLFAALQAGRGTASELAQRAGGARGIESTPAVERATRRWMNVLHNYGVVRIAGYRDEARGGAKSRVFELQRTPFEKPDEDKVLYAEDDQQRSVIGDHVASSGFSRWEASIASGVRERRSAGVEEVARSLAEHP